MSMSIIICLVCSNIVAGGIMLSLGEFVLFMFVDFVFVCVCIHVGLHLGLVVSLAYCHGGSLEVLFVVALPIFDVSNV